jgi:pyruvate/2-oxoacid:ferredoxin oxidoreductase beta subunit
MTAVLPTNAPRATYRNERAYPFCPGCGHTRVLDHLNDALVSLQRDPRKTVIVSDIGCSGLSDQYFITDAFHGLHGRSITYATGVKLARPDLTVVVVIGDGGTGIGGAHLLAAARRNIGLTVLVLNNFNFGMTGGQHSATTPDGAFTSTTPAGNIERPLDICATVGVNGAGHAARHTSADADLSARIADAIECDGFALLDIWGPCTAHYATRNGASRRAVAATLDRLGFATGVLHRAVRPEFTRVHAAASASERASVTVPAVTIEADAAPRIDAPMRLVVAGSAGAKVRSAARLAARAAVLSGLRVTQRDDYPVTVQTGHCVSSLVLSPEEIHFSGVERPDVLLALSDQGAAKVTRQLATMRADDCVYVVPGVALPATRARVTVIDSAAARTSLSPKQVALYALTFVLLDTGLLSVDALTSAASSVGNGRSAAAVATVQAAGRAMRGMLPASSP